jgi:hypothetical protein
MAWKGPAEPITVEGYSRFCRNCGHDLLGLSGQRCPQCGRTFPALVGCPRRHRGRDGRWLVVGVVVAGTVLAVVALRYRNLMPVQSTPVTRPTTLTVDGRGR